MSVVDSFIPGESAAMKALMDPQTGFLSPARLRLYKDKRNDPTVP